MIIATYEEWKEKRLEELDPACDGHEVVTVNCPDCEGYGTIEDEGITTGRTFEVDCDRCGGSGSMQSYELKPGEAEGLIKYDDYLRAAASDLMALSRYKGLPVLHHLIEKGMMPFTRIVIYGEGKLLKRGVCVRCPQRESAVFLSEDFLA